jgi:hypothetical protein
VPGAHAFASCVHDLKLKSRSLHCFLGGPPAIPWLTRYAQLLWRKRTENSKPFLSAITARNNFLRARSRALILTRADQVIE